MQPGSCYKIRNHYSSTDSQHQLRRHSILYFSHGCTGGDSDRYQCIYWRHFFCTGWRNDQSVNWRNNSQHKHCRQFYNYVLDASNRWLRCRIGNNTHHDNGTAYRNGKLFFSFLLPLRWVKLFSWFNRNRRIHRWNVCRQPGRVKH